MQEKLGKPAGFWIRFGALIIDVIILFILSYPIKFALGKIFGTNQLPENFSIAKGLPPNFVYHTLYMLLANEALKFFYSWSLYTYKGATLGKLALGLKVYHVNSGRHPNWFQTLLRDNIGKFISGIFLLIGYLMAAFRSDKRALHDLMAGTIVVHDEGKIEPPFQEDQNPV